MAANKKAGRYRRSLYRRLHPFAFASLEEAIQLAELRGNALVELSHWLKMIGAGERRFDLFFILRHFKVDARQLEADVAAALAKLPSGAASEPRVSLFLDEVITQAWPFTTILFEESRIRTGHLIFTLLKRPELVGGLDTLSDEFAKIKPDELGENFESITSGSQEADASAAPATKGESNAAESGGKEATALDRFTVDLTDKARKGEIDPIIGRDEEVRQIVDILMRRRQNNPVLVGEAGVGKTAVVEGFAHRIVAGDVPESFKQVTLRSLDIGLLQAGASMKGEFEQRLRSVIDEVQKSPSPIILFIDEVHTLMGAGGSAGTGDAANLLKPALARGQLRTVAATTWDEYRKHIEKDPALSRRFQPVFVPEPDEAKAIKMLRAACVHLEKHHRVQILDAAIEAAVRLSVRFVAGRQLPDKAVSLLDTAAARVAISRDGVPARIEDCRRRIQAGEVELDIIQRESLMGADHRERLASIQAALTADRERLAGLEKHFEKEKTLVNRIMELRMQLAEPGNAPITSVEKDAPAGSAEATARRSALLGELESRQTRLAEIQGDSPMLFPCLDQSTVSTIVSEWTGIPVGRMARRNIAEVLDLANVLERRVIGQRHALDLIARRIQSSRAKLENPDRPTGVFMFVGPSGTGKTETAIALAESLYGGEQNLITINMAEFSERHTVSTLKGAPPGYVGYGDGGILTEAVRRRPYSVVLLDEVEKAHPDVHKMFFQVFDKGWMEDSEGRSINFRNTLIILTSNAAQEVINLMCKDVASKPDAEELELALRGPLTKIFPDALLNRLAVVPYYPITTDLLERIIRLNLTRFENRVMENHRLPFTYDNSVVELISRRCAELERGARMIEAVVTNSIIPAVGHEVLARALDGRSLKRVHVKTEGEEFAYEFD